MKRGSLLLVDDDRHLLESMADWLRSLGHQVETADSFPAAQRAVEATAYDLAGFTAAEAAQLAAICV